MKNPQKALPAEWTGELLGKMHNHRISNRDIAKELGVTICISGICRKSTWPQVKI